MTTIAKAFSGGIPTIASDIDSFGVVTLFSGAGLLVSLLLLSAGLDLTVGIF